MSKAQYLCATSSAVLMAAALAASPAWAQAQRSAAPAPGDEVEEVVVTGTFIAGTPEDSAIPVEAVTLEELRQQGTPSNMDLVKNMSESAGVAGEANRANLFAVGAQTINLRGVSASRTVVVFNGRRLPDQYSASVGRFNNIALIPNAAIGRVETLKDGGATTYGADAVGGVVNYITRRNLDGFEASANYRYIRDSDGDYDIDFSAGRVGENWNAMLVAGYQHRSELDVVDRDFALQPYLENPSGWSTYGSPGAYVFQRLVGTTQTSLTPIATAASGNRIGGDVQASVTGVIRDPFCSQLGGFSGFSATPSPVCYYQSNLLSNLVEETDTWQAYGEFNYDFGNGIEFHLEGLYYKLDVPHIPLDSFTGLPLNFPLLAGSATGATQTVGVTSAFTVAGHNPAVRNLLTTLRNSNGTLVFGDPNVAGTQANQIVNGGRVGLVSATWRPFGYGGHPVPELDEQHNYSDTFRVTAQFSGDLPEMGGFKMNWQAAYTFNYLLYHIDFKDISIDRMQAALNGLGGPGCTGTTPGANGCLYFNPFNSAISNNVITQAANPGFVSGLQNSTDLIKWLYVPLELDRQGEYSIFDLLLTGETPFKLWAEDPIQFAVGGQYRYFREEVDLSDLADRALNPCATIGVQTCTTRTGPLMFSRGTGVTGFGFDQDRRYPVASLFFEVQTPVFDRLTLNFSGRYEKFYSDVSTTDNHVFVPQASAKWQVTDWLALRGTVGESFSQVDPPAPREPTVAGNVSVPAAFGTTAVQFTSRNYPNLAVKPETGFNYNVGFIVQLGGFRANVDYYNIEINDLVRAQTTAQLVNALVQPGQLGAAALINCQSQLLSDNQELLGGRPFVQLNGPCVSGQSALNSTGAGGIGGLAGGTINFFGTQGAQTALVNGGDLKTSGLDGNVTWRFDDVIGGQLTLSADATWVLEYEASDYIVAGITVALGYDGVGSQNRATGRNNQRIAEYTGSFGFNYRKGRHNINLTTRFRSSMINDDLTDFVEANQFNANIGSGGVVPSGAACVDTNPISPPVPAGAGTGQFGALAGTTVGFCAGQNLSIVSGVKVPWTWNTDLSYQLTLPSDTTLSVTIQNLLDTDPEFSRDALGYDAFTGSPLGRTIRVGVRKRF